MKTRTLCGLCGLCGSSTNRLPLRGDAPFGVTHTLPAYRHYL
jgi:hypothetical protein